MQENNQNINIPQTNTDLNNQAQLNIRQSQINSSISRSNRNQGVIPLKIIADDQSQSSLIGYCIVFILSMIAFALIARFAIPQGLKRLGLSQTSKGTLFQNCGSSALQISNNIIQCQQVKNYTSNSTITVGSFIANIKNLNQFVLLYLDFTKFVKGKNPPKMLNTQIIISIYQTSRQGSQVLVGNLQFNSSIVINQNFKTLDQRQLFIAIIYKITSDVQYYWEVKFNNANVNLPNNQVLKLNMWTVKEQFTIFTIMVRVVGFIIISLCLLLFVKRLFLFPKGRISVEQKCVRILGFITALFNDQFYVIAVLVPNGFSSFLSSLFMWNYVFYFFGMTTIFLVRILYKQTEPDNQSIFFFVVVYILGLASAAAYAIQKSQNGQVLSIGLLNSTPSFVLRILAILIVIVLIFYIIGLIVSICNNNYYQLKSRESKYILITAFFFIFISFYFLINGFNIYNYNSSQVFIGFAFVNFYTVTMMFLYAPITNQNIVHRMQNAIIHDDADDIQIADEEVTVYVQLDDEIQQRTQKKSFKNSIGVRQRKKINKRIYQRSINSKKQKDQGLKSQIQVQ